MKGRKWVIVIFVLLLSIIGSYMAVFRYFNVNRKVKDFVIDKVSTYMGAEFEASSVYIYPGSFGIIDAKLKLENIPVQVTVRRLRIDYNFFSFIWQILKESRPVFSAQYIFLDDPTITWILDESSETKRKFTISDIPEFSLTALPPIRLNVVNASLHVAKGDSSLILAEAVNGIIDGYRTSSIHFNAEGRVLSTSKNTTAKGILDRNSGAYTIDIASRDCDFSFEGLELITGDIKPESGKLDVDLHIGKGEEGTEYAGSYSIEGGSFSLENLPVKVDDFSIKGQIIENSIEFETVTGKIWDVTPILSGKLTLTPELNLTLKVDANNLDLSTVLPDIFPDKESYPQGFMQLSSEIEGPVKQLSANIRIRSDSLKFANEQLNGIAVDMFESKGDITFNRLSAVYRGHMLQGTGRSINLFNSTAANKSVQVSLSSINISDKKRDFNIDIDGEKIYVNGAKDEYTADFIFELLRANSSQENGKNGTQDINTLTGELSLRDNTLGYSVQNDYIQVNGVADSIFTTPVFDADVKLSQFPLLRYFDVSDKEFNVDGSGKLHGLPGRFSVNGTYRLQFGNIINSILSGEAIVSDIFKNSWNVVSDASLKEHHLLYSHPMFWKVRVNSDSLETKVRILDEQGADLNVSASHETGALSGYLDLDGLPLEWIIDIFNRSEFTHTGILHGRALVGGTLKDSHFSTPERVHISDFNVGGLNNMTGDGYVSGRMGENLKFLDVNFYRNGQIIMNSDGVWERGTPFILDTQNENIELGAISDLISENRDMDGTTDYTLKMMFTRKNGSIDGGFTIRDGHFLDVPFDIASGKLGGGSEGFSVTDFTVSNDGLFTGQGSATSGYLWRDSTEAPGLRLNLFISGDLLQTLPNLTNTINKATGESQITLTLGGTWREPAVYDGELFVSSGSIEPAFLVDAITDINAKLTIDPSIETLSGLTGVRVDAATGNINNTKLIVENFHVGDKEWTQLIEENTELTNIVNSLTSLDFGIFTVNTQKNGNRDASVELHIPGFMKDQEKGTFSISEESKNGFIIGASDSGDKLAPFISGDVVFLSGDFSYPMYEQKAVSEHSDYYSDVNWDLSIQAGSNVNYEREENRTIGAFGTTIFRTLAKLDENSLISVRGRPSDGSLRVTGNARSVSGSITYYGAEFDIERVDIDIDTDNTGSPATLTALARTTAYDDSTGVETEIYLNVYSIDRDSGERRTVLGRVQARNEDYYDTNSSRRMTFDAGALGMGQIEFTSNNPSDDTQEKILARLGISPENFGDAATRAIAAGVDNYYFTSLLRPFENAVRKYTSLDVVRFTPSVLGNIVQNRLGISSIFGPESEYVLFERSRIMLGEYLFDDWFLSYRGNYGLGRDFLNRRERGFYHEVGLQYHLKRNTRFQFNYLYDDVIGIGEKRFEIRHDFEF